jgi:hypothetical protein
MVWNQRLPFLCCHRHQMNGAASFVFFVKQIRDLVLCTLLRSLYVSDIYKWIGRTLSRSKSSWYMCGNSIIKLSRAVGKGPHWRRDLWGEDNIKIEFKELEVSCERNSFGWNFESWAIVACQVLLNDVNFLTISVSFSFSVNVLFIGRL